MSGLAELFEAHRLDRTLAAPPLRSTGAAALVATFGLLLKLTPSEARGLVKLASHDLVPRHDLHAATSSTGEPRSDIGILDVIIHRLRRKLSPHAIAIITITGHGYRLAPKGRERLRELLMAYGQDVVAAVSPPAARPVPRKRAPRRAEEAAAT